ncbi:MAG: TonB-dependent receptor, partial [Candidatus Binatia bacterium]
LYNTTDDDNPQKTGEVRVSSPELAGFLGLADLFGISLGTSRVLGGFFYQDRRIEDSKLTIGINLPAEGQFLAYNSLPAGTPVPPIDAFIGPAVQIGLIGLFDTLADPEARTNMFYTQKTKSYAGFSNLSWSPLERFEIEYGMRFTVEQKEATWNRFNEPFGTGSAFAVLGGEEFVAARDRSESAFTPKASLRYEWSDEIGLYFAWSKGFKAGGYNEQAHNNTDAALEYDAEKAEAFEIGAKMRLLDDTLSLNVDLFRHDVTDFQVLTLPPLSVSTTVVNAGEARAQGLEADSTWLATDWLTLYATLSFNDSEFLEFPLGQCSFDRTDTDGNGDGRCDATGQPLFRTPKWASALAANLRFPLASLPRIGSLDLLSQSGIDLLGGGTAEYQDVQYLERTYDERVRQSPFVRFGLNAGIANEEQGWSLRISVENLTDRSTGVLIRDVPLGGGNFYKILEPQRLVFGAFRWTF